ncbi:energy-coupling factor transporter transmembrane component T [Spiroplasma endosymbiont of Aspidapion aeneum]|uniref:energy-coupling factor transporter transmembrane component T family protein n=1 Tax=Spiroplasma endosymbiont of Aspidapion aeneum TaxID=3066276 RepID=UPI00313B23F2
MRLAFGRYIPSNSIIHKMDARLKLFMLLCLMVSIFFPIGFTGLIGVTVIATVLIIVGNISFPMMMKLFKPVILMFILMFIINIFMIKTSLSNISITHTYSIFDVGKSDSLGYFLRINGKYLSERALYKAFYMAWRIFLTIGFATILTSTTQPIELTLAIEDLLSPLKLIKIPVYIFSTIISIALRMIPTLIEEATRIMKAQSSRGIDFKNGKMNEKVKSIVSLIIPLLVSSFQKAEDLAYAMDSRGYNPNGKRTRYRQVNIRVQDIIIFIIGVGVAGMAIAYAFTPSFNSYQIPHVDAILGIIS